MIWLSLAQKFVMPWWRSSQDPLVQAQSGPLLRAALKTADTGSALGLFKSKFKQEAPAAAPSTVVVLPPENTVSHGV